MRLGFLLERRYAPYSKWLGSAFARLDCANEVGPALAQMLSADDFEARESGWVEAIEALARRHNALGLTAHLEPTARAFYSRPYCVIGAGRFAAACIESVTDPWLRDLPRVGGIGQFVDSTDVLSVGELTGRAAGFYGPMRRERRRVGARLDGGVHRERGLCGGCQHERCKRYPEPAQHPAEGSLGPCGPC